MDANWPMRSMDADYFQAERRGGRDGGIVHVATMKLVSRGPDAEGMVTIGAGDDEIESATLPIAEAVEWLVSRRCVRTEAVRMCEQVNRTMLAQSVGTAPTATERILGSPV